MKKCLIVDDSRVVRKVAKRMLEGLGFNVQEAENGKQALEMCAKELPDLILLDWNMPEMDGIQFLEKFRKDPQSSKTRIVFCTTENTMDKISRAITCGANEYIMKPFDEGILKFKLQQVGVI